MRTVPHRSELDGGLVVAEAGAFAPGARVEDVDADDVDADGAEWLAQVGVLAEQFERERGKFVFFVLVDGGLWGRGVWVRGVGAARFDFDEDELAFVVGFADEIELAAGEDDVAVEDAIAPAAEVAGGGGFAAAADEGGVGRGEAEKDSETPWEHVGVRVRGRG
jgi:hypothetical protein